MSFVCATFNFLIFFKKLFYHQFLILLVHVDLCSSSHNDFFNSCSFFKPAYMCIYIKELVVKQYVYIKSKWHNATKCLFTMKYAWFFLYISAIFLWYTGTCFYGYDDMDILYKNVFNPQRVVDWMLLIRGFLNKLPEFIYLAHIGESILLIQGPRPFPGGDETYVSIAKTSALLISTAFAIKCDLS